MRSPAARTLADYGVIARRSWWLIVGTVAAAAAAGIGYTASSEVVYESTASVLVLPTGVDAQVAGARTSGQVNLDTEAQLVQSTEVAGAAAERLAAASTVELAEQVSVSVPPNTSVLEISFRAGDPQAARAGTVAFSDAYLEHRRAAATASIDAEIDAARNRLDSLESDIDDLESDLEGLGEFAQGRGALESALSELADMVGEAEAEIAALEAEREAVAPGRVINHPVLPDRPIQPDPLLNLAAAVGAGLPAGLLLAWARHRLARRISYPSDLVERCELTVLGSVPKTVRFQRREVFGAYSPGGRIFSQMRNVIVSRLPADQRVVVVAGVAPGPASSVVAANLATAMARAGDRVTAVAANPSTTVGLPELFGTEPVPGLADVWSGRTALEESVRPAPRQPSLSVVGPGAAARATGPTSEAATATFTRLADGGRFVIVDAPPLSCSADAQLLAGHADAVILAVQAHRDSVAETAAAAAAMRQIDRPILGAVLLPGALGPMGDVPMPGERPPARVPRPSPMAADENPTETLDVAEAPTQVLRVDGQTR